MRELANQLEHMGCINRDIRLAVAMTGPHCDRLLVLRADFSYECNQLHNQLTAGLAAPERAQLASRLLNLFVSMHRTLSQHQLRWSYAEIERDPAGYTDRARQMNASVIDFVEDALAAISSVVSAPQTACAIAPEAELRLTGTR